MQVRFGGLETIPLDRKIIDKLSEKPLSGFTSVQNVFVDRDRSRVVVPYDGPASAEVDGTIAFRAMQMIISALQDAPHLVEEALGQIQQFFIDKTVEPERQPVGFARTDKPD